MKTSDVSRQVLTETPGRALVFLRAVATNPDIRARLASAGYQKSDHDEGVRLLNTSLIECVPGGGAATDESWRGGGFRGDPYIAMAEAFVKGPFRCAMAALARRHPREYAVLFANIDAPSVSARYSAAMFFRRLETHALDPSASPESRADWDAALATLEARGISRELRARFAAVFEEPTPATPVADRDADERALHALRAWYVEWAETARAVMVTREELIRLGLARRHRGEGDAGSEVAART